MLSSAWKSSYLERTFQVPICSISFVRKSKFIHYNADAHLLEQKLKKCNDNIAKKEGQLSCELTPFFKNILINGGFFTLKPKMHRLVLPAWQRWMRMQTNGSVIKASNRLPKQQ